jgi:hypothetical protein
MEACGKTLPSNSEIARVLDTLAELFAAKGATPLKARAYSAAAEKVRADDRRAAELARAGGRRRLGKLLGIDDDAASVICEYVSEGARPAPIPAPPGRLRPMHELRRSPRDASVSLLLEVDREYRSKAREGSLSGEPWLPVLQVERGGCLFTVTFSNTARAHQLAKTRDWVVLRYVRNGEEHRCTVVTERRGKLLAGLRVVRGREQACRRHYADRLPRKAA